MVNTDENSWFEEMIEQSKMTPEKWKNLIDWEEHSWSPLGLRDTMKKEEFPEVLGLVEERYGKPIFEEGNFVSEGNDVERVRRILGREMTHIELDERVRLYFHKQRNGYRVVVIESPKPDWDFFVTDVHDVGLFCYVLQDELSRTCWEFESRNKRKPIVRYEIVPQKETGVQTDVHVLDPKTCLSLQGLSKVAKRLYFRNLEMGHEVTGGEDWNPGIPTFAQPLVEKYGGELPEPPEARKMFDVMVDTDPRNSYELYHTPVSVLVTAGFRFRTKLAQPQEDYKRFLGSLGDLETGFEHRARRELGDKIGRLLDGTIQVGQREDWLSICGESFDQGRPIGPRQIHGWRGKVQNFANFVHTVEQALKRIPTTETSLESGSSPCGLHLLFYGTGAGHEHDDLLPTAIIGYVNEFPSKGARIYAGNELEVTYRLE